MAIGKRPMRKNRHFKLLLVIAFLTLALASCKKNMPVLTANAIIINTGDPAYDGCGWLIKLSSNNTEYSPTNLTPAFQKDSLKVNISYTLLNSKYRCGFGPGVQQIKINDIKQVSP
jgi:hypothetical protein